MKTEKELNDLFDLAKNQTPITSFEETKEKFLQLLNDSENQNLNKGKSKLFNFKNGLIMLVISVLSVLSYLSINSNSEKHISKEYKVKPLEIKTERSFYSPNKIENNKSVRQFIEEDKIYSISLYLKRDSLPIENQISANNVLTKGQNVIFDKSTINPKDEPDDQYKIPKLTEEEIKTNNKNKKAMLKALAKFDSDNYSYVPSGTFDYNGKTISVQGFYIGVTEVTNLEYKTFLFDLLIQGRNEEFLKARPDQTQWIKLKWGEANQMKEYYFGHIGYYDFPVVNISREGAELYCQWLSREIYKYAESKDINIKFNDVRIPFREEWVKAASFEGKNNVYPWGTDSVKNSLGNYLANLNTKNFDGYYDKDGGFYPVSANSYNPNDYGLYCLSGNVAEMVWGFDTSSKTKTNPGTKGGGWMDEEEVLKIYGPDPYLNILSPHPNIGFRVVMTAPRNGK